MTNRANEFLIEVSHLSKSYGEKAEALRDISFKLKRGEILGLLGPNGAGKTTVIHILLGLLTPTRGDVRVLGMNPLHKRNILADRLNFSSAYTSLPSNLKVIQNLMTFAGLYGVKNSRQKIQELLRLFDVERLKTRVTGGLSSGEKTRVNLCKCLLNDPELLLLDEPTASLDPDAADVTRRLIKKLQSERQMGILYTSHNMHEVEQICDRVIFIYDGRIAAEGTPGEIMASFQTKNLEDVFLKITRGGAA